MAKANTVTNTVTVGIDLGDRFSQICFLDGRGEVIEESRIRTTEEAFRTRFGTDESFLAVMEVGTHSPWVSRLLAGMGHECLVVNPASLHRKGRKKSDRIDAEKLARNLHRDQPFRSAYGSEINSDLQRPRPLNSPGLLMEE